MRQSNYFFSSSLNNNLRFSNKIVIVTGGSSGIGEATCKQFAKEGASVVIADKNKEGGLRVAKYISDTFKTPVHFVLADLSKESDCKRITEEASNQFGGVDVLINDAAILNCKGIEATVQDFESSYRINVIGTFLVTKYAIESMKTRGGGAIVNLSSIGALIASPNIYTYSPTKAAVLQMTRDMALDFGKFNIRVNAICPGIIDTPMIKDLGVEMDENIKHIESSLIIRRMGRPEEMATAIAFLASNDASYITGTHLVADGGYTTL